jgi:hypothetical protein
MGLLTHQLLLTPTTHHSPTNTHYSQSLHSSQAPPVAHTCNPSYSGGRDQEDRSSKPAWKNSL